MKELLQWHVEKNKKITKLIDNVKMETAEIQADDVVDIAKHSAIEASEKLKCSVLKNDTGLFVEALGGFPGPYTHYVDEKLSGDGLLKLLEGVENRKACFIEAYAYCEYGKEPVVFKSITNGVIAKEKSGIYGWSWDFALYLRAMIKQWVTMVMILDVVFGIRMLLKH